MGLDIRLPLGLLFLAIGALLTFYGLITRGSDMYAHSMGVNLNLLWGAILLFAGLLSAWFGRKRRS